MRRRAAALGAVEHPLSFPSAGPVNVVFGSSARWPVSSCAAPVTWAAAGVKPSSFIALLRGGRLRWQHRSFLLVLTMAFCSELVGTALPAAL